MVKRMTGLALVVFSDVMLVIALAADPLGLGQEPHVIGYSSWGWSCPRWKQRQRGT